jgi:CRP-like cAMP-binding protein
MDVSKLDAAPLFASLPDDAKRELAGYLNESVVAGGKHLVDQGDQSYNLFVIVDGKAEVYKDGKSVAELGPGDFFGEMGTVGDAPRSATVVSQKRTRLLTLGARDVQRLKDTAPGVLEQLERAIEQRSG